MNIIEAVKSGKPFRIVDSPNWKFVSSDGAIRFALWHPSVSFGNQEVFARKTLHLYYFDKDEILSENYELKDDE